MKDTGPDWFTSAFSALSEVQKGEKDQRALNRMARVNDQQTFADEEAMRRRAHLFAGEMAASMAQMGATDYGVAKQNLVTLELDALNTRYQGQQRTLDLRARAASAGRKGYLAGAKELLQGYASNDLQPRIRTQPKASISTGTGMSDSLNSPKFGSVA